MELWELVVREAVRDLVARYTWAGDRGDSVGVADLFALDGILDVGAHGGIWTGRDRIRRELEEVADRTAAAGGGAGPVRHHVSSLRIDVLGPTEAEAASYFAVHTVIGLDHWGRYRDRIARGPDDVWRFTARTVRIDGHTEGSLMVRGS